VFTEPRTVQLHSNSSSRVARLDMGHEQHSLPRHSSSHPVLHVMHQRLQEGSSSRPGCRRDGYKLGLVVEGGGMRGIVTVRGLLRWLHVDQCGHMRQLQQGSCSGSCTDEFGEPACAFDLLEKLPVQAVQC
jgi:hypothetical protein